MNGESVARGVSFAPLKEQYRDRIFVPFLIPCESSIFSPPLLCVSSILSLILSLHPQFCCTRSGAKYSAAPNRMGLADVSHDGFTSFSQDDEEPAILTWRFPFIPSLVSHFTRTITRQRIR